MKDLTLPTPPVTVRVLDTAIWIESDMFGAWHVVVQHEGMDAFTFATFNYRYGYTDNASTHAAAVQMAIDLGAPEPIEERQRGDNFADAILAIRNGEVEYKSWEPVSNHEDGRAEPVWCSCGDAIMPDTGAKCGVCASGVVALGDGGRAATSELEQMRERKDAAYLERNQVVAALAKCFPSGVARTAIEGWSEDWHGCVYIDLPTGQASWHFHDSHAYLFDSLPPYTGTWDGHDTPEKYARLAKLGVALGGEKGEPPCSEHPDAPHGYNRSASHNAGRYVCDCEGWAAMGGEKGEAVAETENALRPDHPLAKGSCVHGESMAKHCAWCSARPVGKARMLTEAEADHITGMHNTGRAQGDSECAEAIQRKFCEVNGIEVSP